MNTQTVQRHLENTDPTTDQRSPSVLRLLIEIPETNAPYQQLTVPLADRQRITLCTYFRAAQQVPKSIRLYEGDGSMKLFLKNLRLALKSDQYDVIHAHTPHVALAFLLVAWNQPKLMKTTVFTVHNCYENHKLRNRLMVIWAFAFFKRVICCGRSSLNSFPWFYRWLGGSRLRCIQNGVDIERIESVKHASLDQPDRPFTVASISRLVPIKNLFTMMNAWASLDRGDSRLIVVGDGPQREVLTDECNTLGTGNSVHFTGLVERNEVYRHMFASDLYVSTSLGEGLPVAVLEAMACGCPVVLSDIPSHREIAEGVDFIPLVDPNDVHGFTREIARFKEMSREERIVVGRQCEQLVRDRFSLASVHSAYDQVYGEVMQGGPAS